MSRHVGNAATHRIRHARAALATAIALLVSLVAAGQARAIQFDSLGASVFDTAGAVRQAGSHPDIRFTFKVPTAQNPDDPLLVRPVEQPHRLQVDLPLGLTGDPTAAETCVETKLKVLSNGTAPDCPIGAQVGYVRVLETTTAPGAGYAAALYNIARPAGSPGLFAFVAYGAVVKMTPSVRAGDYGISIDSGTISQGLGGLYGAEVTLWGVPADPVHDPERLANTAFGTVGGNASQSPRRPFLTLPTSCPGVADTTTARLDGWQSIGDYVTRSFSSDFDGVPFITTGCERLGFEPAMNVQVTSRRADAPTGLNVDLSVPQSESPNAYATAHVKKVAVTLPEGMSVSPSSAAGLGACAPSEIGLGSDAAPSCPRSSKIGSVEIVTPVLEEPLKGDVILAKQNDNPFGSLLAMYVVAEGSGVRVKLPGRVDANAVTGQLVATFDNNPQLPFSDLRVTFDTGPQAPLATPAACGTYTTHAEITSWSGKVVGSDSRMVIDQGCDTGGFAPRFSAGSVVPAGGASSPFTLTFSRKDGEQLLSALDVTLPPGLLATIGSVPLCAEAQAAAGTCGAASRVGHTSVLAGPGATPLSVPEPGKAPTGVFLAGPYKGAPLSLSILVPAQAGPFDLGNVVVRAALFVDRADGHVTVKSDPIPSIVEGIPLRVRQVTVDVDRERFMVNSTNCRAMQVSGQLRSVAGSTADVASRYQLGNCATLAFAPRLMLSVGTKGTAAASKAKAARKGKAKARRAAASGPAELRDGGHPALSARLEMDPNSANNQKATVALPLALALDPDNANGLCEPVDAARDKCPAASIVGSVSAVSPLLTGKVAGPVYFVRGERKDPKSGRTIRTLPKLFVPLTASDYPGLKVDLHASSDVVDERLVTTFDNLPDVPISGFDLKIDGGAHGILVVSNTNMCESTQYNDNVLTAQSGKRYVSKTGLDTACPLAIVKSSRSGGALNLTVGGVAPGKVTISGNGLAKKAKTIPVAKPSGGEGSAVTVSATTHTSVAVPLSKATRRALAAGRDVRVKVTVAFKAQGTAKATKTTKTTKAITIHGAK